MGKQDVLQGVIDSFGNVFSYDALLYWRDASHTIRLLYWRYASHNTLDYCIGGMDLTIH